MMLLFNIESGELGDADWRRLIVHLLDIEAIMSTVTLGYATLGHPGGNSFSTIEEGLDFTLLVQSGNVTRIRAAELIAEQLSEAGINVTVVAMESDTVDSLVWPGFDVSQGRHFDMAMWGWSAATWLDPGTIVRIGASNHTIGDLNLGAFRNAEFDALAEMHLAATDATERERLSALMQEILDNYLPFVTLWYEDLSFAVNAYHHNGWVLQAGTGIINRFSFLP